MKLEKASLLNSPLTGIASTDPICALATQAGGAIGVIRTSGKGVVEIVESIFSKPLNNAHPNTLHYGEITDEQGNTIDQVVVSLWRAPHSYTGEDAVEISCHGSAIVLQQVLIRLSEAGCRQAEPGEFTQRAYFNGKLDLSQAEAVADLIASTNKASYQIALSQLKGHFSNELALLREQLLKMTSLIELELDFSDHEELEFADRSELKTLAMKIDNKVVSLAHSFQTGEALKKGIPVAIVGQTNVGKSTLLNCLLKENKAIVSDIHGTTRDVIEDTMSICGVDFLFIDTAGIRETTDEIEQIGINRAYEKLNKAQIVLWVIDKTPTNEERTEMLQRCEGKQLLIVRNKAEKELSEDNNRTENQEDDEIRISAKYQIGIAHLEERIFKAADLPELTENTVIVTNARHYDALTAAHDALTYVMQALEMNLSGDLIAEDLKLVIEELGKITGKQINSQETLINIFKNFCIGK
ncbi:MAG: tRNA uridine-5-carboxymethylaminomethyl(34) synthesis GTPase MnmE [Prevotella sp.]|nr:tRNA uridine-5-carboxymethylaminomethyl(34) synthesis GTPase MnmE [Prevotella sp.]MDD7272804.1 tRNA uridine-5-carboxymethylaminomethyl(34) synthesis GTPase MnmE [Prevotellaceae bacterium]MDY3936608.1 tRNA uridine-5-carboxymethylaminomethyl(34) synthesis GTPase MnmE [Prevotella sp.]MDY4218466.1 tRNA uridine-5-carboxymethylaminomethyl(34) synthesis GTPase MnmE [Prevotella sp.]